MKLHRPTKSFSQANYSLGERRFSFDYVGDSEKLNARVDHGDFDVQLHQGIEAVNGLSEVDWFG